MIAVVNHITAPIIEKNNNAQANEALLVVMPDGKNFESIDLSEYTLPQTITEAHKEEGGGYVFRQCPCKRRRNYGIPLLA
jgi:Na+-translocating ferredoxin:NAD+ oxidoreductase RnfG subunit